MYEISFHLKLYTIIYWTKKYSPKLRFHNKVIYKCKSDGCELVNQHCIWSKREGFVGLVKLNMTNRRAWHFIDFVKTSWLFHENKIIKSQTIPCLYLASDRLRRPGWLGRRRRRWCTFLRRRRWGWCPSTALTSSTNCKQTEKTTCMYEVINTSRDEWMGYSL